MPVFLQKMEKLRPFYDMTYKVLLFVCRVLLIADIVITSWSIAGRYLPFLRDPYWSEEIVLTLMVYMAVLSAALAIRRRAHIRMTAFDHYLPKKVLKVSDLLADSAVLVLGMVLLVNGIRLCTSPLAELGRYASIPSLSKFVQYLSIPAAGAGMVIFELEQVFLDIESFYKEA